MDEVDFTILAATSVLGDLIEKCPPAEACRDAFNRMSKATVQMCMSTTGFSSSVSAQGFSSRSQPPRSRTDEHMNPDYFGPTSANQFATSNARTHKNSSKPNRLSNEQQQQSNVSRPKPQFDMGLNDLFPAGQSQTDAQQTAFRSPLSTHNNTTRAVTVKKEFNASEAFGIPASQIHSPSDYAISPTQTRATPTITTPIDPALLPNQSSTSNSQISPSGSGTYGPAPQLEANNWSFNDLDFPLQGMDFLQSGNTGIVQGNSGPEQAGGMDLGFGLGWEGMDHDFSEGNQLDLFEGFFFGSSGAY